jgi:hypothetical protein
VHESLPLKGKQYNDLPAAVLEVSESSLAGVYSVQFMCAMGCEIAHRVARKCYVFVCSHEDVEVQVRPATSLRPWFCHRPSGAEVLCVCVQP